MDSMKQFLGEIGFVHEREDTEKLIEAFASEMEKGLTKDEESSLMMIPTFISGETEIIKGEPVVVLDAGGTNLRAAKVIFDQDGEPEILELKMSSMPGYKETVSAEDMFDRFALLAKPMLGPSGRVTLCFSYAFTYLPGGDGQLLNLGKEVDVTGVVGSKLGEGLIAAFRRAGEKGPISVRVINDTDAVLMSAVSTGAVNPIGMILGTGFNMTYMEKGCNIKKLEGEVQPRMSINMEAGGFAFAPVSVPDEMLNEETLLKDYHPFEKKVSGAYLCKLIRIITDIAAEKGLISEESALRLQKTDGLNMKELGNYINGSESVLCEIINESDRKNFSEIVTSVEKRSGRLAAAALASVMLRMRENGDQGEMVIAVNGSTFLKNKTISEECINALKEWGNKLGEYRFISMENDTLIGSAAASFLK